MVIVPWLVSTVAVANGAVVDDLGVPRPTVRRVARELRNELLGKIEALQEEIAASEGRGGKK